MSSSMSSIIESQILHTTTTRTLHAHNFTKSSTQATHMLTDVLSRYFALLAGTCARYAQHAGRTGVNIRDALAALEEVGLSIDELRGYVEGEGRELVRYTGQTARRTEELEEVKVSLSEGLKRDQSDSLQLIYAPILDIDTSGPSFSQDEDEGEASEMQFESVTVPESKAMLFRGRPADMASDMTRTLDPYTDLITPPSSPYLPVSPVSPTHTRKRARTSSWKAPDYVPDFLPPFPGHPVSPSHKPIPLHTDPPPRIDSSEQNVASPVPVSSSTTAVPLESQPKLDHKHQPQLPPQPPSPALPTSTTTSSFLSSVPYEHSSLSSIPEWHLPKPPPDMPPLAVSSTLPALLSSHSYLQSSSLSAPSLLPPNPSRHGLAMILLGVSSRAYSPAATLFASSNTNICAPLPHRAAPLATHAVPLDKNGKANFNLTPPRGTLPLPPPEWHGHSAAGPVAIVDTTTVQGSRIPTLARTVLSAPVIARTTRLVPPPPLERNDQKLLYGPPVPAPWNSTSGVNAAEGRGAKGNKDKDEEEEEADKVLSDAHLFATWDYDSKDFRSGIPMARRGSKMVMGLGGTNGTMPLPLKRKRSDSMVPPRRGSEAGPTLTRIKTER